VAFIDAHRDDVVEGARLGVEPICRVLQVAPGSTDVASAGLSAVFNASIAAGALIGALLLPTFGLRSTALVAAILVGGAAGLLGLEPRPVAGLQGVRAGEC